MGVKLTPENPGFRSSRRQRLTSARCDADRYGGRDGAVSTVFNFFANDEVCRPSKSSPPPTCCRLLSKPLQPTPHAEVARTLIALVAAKEARGSGGGSLSTRRQLMAMWQGRWPEPEPSSVPGLPDSVDRLGRHLAARSLTNAPQARVGIFATSDAGFQAATAESLVCRTTHPLSSAPAVPTPRASAGLPLSLSHSSDRAQEWRLSH
jgi:hypothetical protein